MSFYIPVFTAYLVDLNYQACIGFVFSLIFTAQSGIPHFHPPV